MALKQNLTHKITETRDDKVFTPFNIEQALDARYVIIRRKYIIDIQFFKNISYVEMQSQKQYIHVYLHGLLSVLIILYVMTL